MRRLIAVIVVTVAVLAGCGADEHGDDHTPADKEALATIESGLETMFSWQPGVDRDRRDAYVRAEPWLTDGLAAQSGQTTERGPGMQWDQWARERATVTAAVVVLGTEHGPDQPDRIDRVVLITQNVTDPGGKVTESIDLNARVFVVRTGAGWRIEQITFE